MSIKKRATLFIEAAIAGGNLALSIDGKTFGAVRESGETSRSESLLPAIEALLRETDIRKNDLERVVVSRGPGSFTGLRIGIAVALGLAEGLQVPVAGAELAEAIVSRFFIADGDLVILPFGKRDAAILYGADPTRWKSLPAAMLGRELEKHFSRVFAHANLDDRAVEAAGGVDKLHKIGPNLALILAEARNGGMLKLSEAEPVYLAAAAYQSRNAD